MDESVFNKGSVSDDTLLLRFKELQLLDQVCVVLVELLISMDVGEESPVIEVVDSILENGISGAVAPEATMEPGRKGLKGFVRGVIWSGV